MDDPETSEQLRRLVRWYWGIILIAFLVGFIVWSIWALAEGPAVGESEKSYELFFATLYVSFIGIPLVIWVTSKLPASMRPYYISNPIGAFVCVVAYYALRFVVSVMQGIVLLFG